MAKVPLLWLCAASIMVKCSTHKPMIEGLNPATCTKREKDQKISVPLHKSSLCNLGYVLIAKVPLLWLCTGSIVVNCSTPKPMIEGLTPATCTKR